MDDNIYMEEIKTHDPYYEEIVPDTYYPQGTREEFESAIRSLRIMDAYAGMNLENAVRIEEIVHKPQSEAEDLLLLRRDVKRLRGEEEQTRRAMSEVLEQISDLRRKIKE